jgi:SAM-dependent methyltransferase
MSRNKIAVAMPPTVDSYRISAKYYDGAYGAMKDLVDTRFYCELARQYGGPVLEIGCGTGRILLAIARLGVEVHGVDNSAPMLATLKENLGREKPGTRDRVSLHGADMRDFRLGRRFPLVTIPFRPMQHMYTVTDQVRALTSAAAHLQGDGILAFDVFYPKFERLPLRLGEEQLEAEWSPEPGTVIRRFFRKDSFDKIRQSFTVTLIFRVYGDGRLSSEERETLSMSYYTYPQLRALFLLAGLEPVAEYGSFAKTPLDNDSEEMIFLLRSAGS